MAKDLYSYLSQQLEALPREHPDRRFLQEMRQQTRIKLIHDGYDPALLPSGLPSDTKEDIEQSSENVEDIKQKWFAAKVSERLGSLRNQAPDQAAKKVIDGVFWELFVKEEPTAVKQFQEKVRGIGVEQQTLDNLEEAEQYLGINNVLGPDALVTLELLFAAHGEQVEFDLSSVPSFGYRQEDWRFAQKHGEMLVFRPAQWRLNDAEISPSISTIHALFFTNMLHPDQPLFKRPPLLFNNTWNHEALMTYTPMTAWGLVKKNILPNSDYVSGKKDYYSKDDKERYYISWNYSTQTPLLHQYNDLLRNSNCIDQARRRTATEALWDTLLVYFITDTKLLPNHVDCSNTEIYERFVGIGGFDEKGIFVHDAYYDINCAISSNEPLPGLCPTR